LDLGETPPQSNIELKSAREKVKDGVEVNSWISKWVV
jgi:hypothetical protein